MKVLIVGGAGYIGGAVTDILAQPRYTYGIDIAGATEHQFRVYDSLLYEESYRKPVPFVRGDIRDHAKLIPQLEWADVVIWLAAVVGHAAWNDGPQDRYGKGWDLGQPSSEKIWTDGTFHPDCLYEKLKRRYP